MDNTPRCPQAAQGDESALMNRRRFLGYASGVLSGAIAFALGLPLARFFVGNTFAKRSPRWLRLGESREISVGRPQLFRLSHRDTDGWRQLMRREAVYVVTEDGARFTVFSSACTHLGCPVHWDDGEQLFLCPCHNGAFSKEGAVAKGPPPRPLDRLEYRLDDDVLYVRVAKV
ncbi:MAG: Rieske 2Fe-2S domain-containing protein [Gemmatimonadales bacterium]|nr:Rieske 2Fe-2S domain-containing protein [Gemmatimonadales bacterium]